VHRATLHGISNAMLNVIVKEQERNPVQRRLDRLHLGEDVNAVPLLVHHPLQTAGCPSIRRSRFCMASL